MKTIFHLTGMRSSKYGGLEKYFLEVGRQSKSKNIQLILFYNEYPKSKQYLKELSKANIEVKILKKENFFLIPSLFFFMLLLLRHKPSAVHCHFSPSYPYAVLANFFGIKTYVTIHSLMTTSSGFPIMAKDQISIKTRLVRKILFRNVDTIFSISKAIKSQIISFFDVSEKIFTHYIGVQKKQIPYLSKEIREKKKEVVITNIAWHGKVKGVDLLLKAVKILVGKGINNFCINQIGNAGEETSKLVQYCEDNQLEKYIKWLGVTDNVDYYLSQSDIYCQPSRSEGLSISILEGMTHSLPIVATKVGGIPELVIDGYNGFLSPVYEDSVALAANLERLIMNSAERKVLGKNSYRLYKEKYDVKLQVAKQLKFYNI